MSMSNLMSVMSSCKFANLSENVSLHVPRMPSTGPCLFQSSGRPGHVDAVELHLLPIPTRKSEVRETSPCCMHASESSPETSRRTHPRLELNYSLQHPRARIPAGCKQGSPEPTEARTKLTRGDLVGAETPAGKECFEYHLVPFSRPRAFHNRSCCTTLMLFKIAALP